MQIYLQCQLFYSKKGMRMPTQLAKYVSCSNSGRSFIAKKSLFQ